jgi:nucleoside-diphosphate-sugar epimerase
MNKNCPNTIIGSGFLAKNFGKYEELFKKLNICVYAAGVSNSLCKDRKLLEKDKKRLYDFRDKINKSKILLYFGTCSSYDPSRNKNPYVKNKLEIENFIKKNFQKYLIIRLPKVVGKSINSNTLINFFFEKIKRNEIFNLWTKARRSVIDIDDVTKILINLLSNTKHENKTINIANPEKYSSIHIVKIIENLTAKKAKYNLVNKGEDNWTTDVSQIIDSIENCKIKFNRNYLKYTLEKYFI